MEERRLLTTVAPATSYFDWLVASFRRAQDQNQSNPGAVNVATHFKNPNLIHLPKPIPGYGSEVVARLHQHLVSMHASKSELRFNAEITISDSAQRAMSIAAAELRYTELYNQDISRITKAMEIIESIAESIEGPTSLSGDAFTTNLGAKNYLRQHTENGFRALLDARLTKLADYSRSDLAKTNIGQTAHGLTILDRALLVFEGFRAGTGDSTSPARMLDWMSLVLSCATELSPPRVEQNIGVYASTVDNISEALRKMLANDGQANAEAIGRGLAPQNDAAEYGFDWAKNILESFGLDWKILFPGAYNGN